MRRAGDGPQTLLPAQATPSVWERGDLVVPQGSLISACSWRHPLRVLRRPPTRQLGSPSPTLGGPRRPPGLDGPGGVGNCGHPSITRACSEYPRSVHLPRALHWIFPRVTRACDSVSQLEQKTPQPTPFLSPALLLSLPPFGAKMLKRTAWARASFLSSHPPWHRLDFSPTCSSQGHRNLCAVNPTVLSVTLHLRVPFPPPSPGFFFCLWRLLLGLC